MRRQACHLPLDESLLETQILDRNSSQSEAVVDKSSWSVQDAKNHFSTVIEAARREPQTVTKHGKPAAVILSSDDYARLRQLAQRNAPTFVEHLLAMPSDGSDFDRLQGKLRDVEF